MVHNIDLVELINELKNTGAEAISINGQRITSATAIVCSGAIVTINDVKVSSPFEIRAIGKITTLVGGIERPGGYLSIMEDEGIEAHLERSNNVTIAKYTGTNNPKYMKIVE